MFDFIKSKNFKLPKRSGIFAIFDDQTDANGNPPAEPNTCDEQEDAGEWSFASRGRPKKTRIFDRQTIENGFCPA
jgi:hypothetical protein